MKRSPLRRISSKTPCGFARRAGAIEQVTQLGRAQLIVREHHRQVLLADDLLGGVAVHPVRALVPGHDAAFEVDRDDRVLGRAVEHAGEEQRAFSTSCSAWQRTSCVFLNSWTKTATFARRISGSNGLKM